MPEIVLASQSPRRRELLSLAFSDFIIMPSNADETLPDGLSPEESVVEIAKRKVLDIRQRVSCDSLVIGADTIVVKDGAILGKPVDKEDAFNMLSSLSGNTHTVYTGVVLAKGDKLSCSYEATDVTFRTLSDDEINAYIATGEPMDKAGAYGIQQLGAFLVEKICGDYFNVVGLPMCKLGKMLSEFGIKIL